MHIMFAKQSNYEVKMPGYFTIPMKFRLEELEQFID